MCTCGMDMATQQATPATHSSVCRAPGESPSVLTEPAARAGAAAAPDADCAGSGGRGRRIRARGSIAARQNKPIPI